MTLTQTAEAQRGTITLRAGDRIIVENRTSVNHGKTGVIRHFLRSHDGTRTFVEIDTDCCGAIMEEIAAIRLNGGAEDGG